MFCELIIVFLALSGVVIPGGMHVFSWLCFVLK